MVADNTEAPVAPLPIGTLIDRYRIEQFDARSDHFSLLYRARDTISNAEVLLKEFAPAEFMVREGLELRARSEDARRTIHWGLRGFADQAAGLQSLRLPHVLQVLQVVEANGTAYYASAPLSGETLAARLDREQTLPSTVLLPLVDQLLEPLAQIHTAGLLHWDIRPENILIDSDGSPWLVDFGAARFVMRFKFRSIYSVVMPGYAPPEVYSASARPGPTTDLYSVAATIYRALSGAVPADSLRLSRGEAALTPALKIGYNSFPSEFLKAVDWGLRLDAEQRPKSAAEWREALAGRAPVPAPKIGSTAPVAAAPRTVPAAPAPRAASPAPAASAPKAGSTAPVVAAPRVAAPSPATPASAIPALPISEPPAPTPATPPDADADYPSTRTADAEIALLGPAPAFRPQSKPLGMMMVAGCALFLVLAVVVFVIHRKSPAAPITVAEGPKVATPSQAPAAAPAPGPAPAERASPPASAAPHDQLFASTSQDEIVARAQAADQARENERLRKLDAAKEQEKAQRSAALRTQQAPANGKPTLESGVQANGTVQQPAVQAVQTPVQAATTPASSTTPSPSAGAQASGTAQQPAVPAARTPVQAATATMPTPAPSARANGTAQQSAAPAARTPVPAAPATMPASTAVAEAPAVRTPPSRDPSHPCAAPQYPSGARFASEAGTSVVELSIDVDGSVTDSRVADSSGYYDLDQAARAGFSRCKWKPGMLNGKPEAARLLVKISWKLK